MKNNKKRNLLLSLILAAVCIAFLLYVDKFQHYSMLATVLKKGAIYSLVAVSLNLLNGFTGLFSLGQAGFMLLGAYSYAVLCIPVAKRAGVYQYFDGGIVKFSLPEIFASFLGDKVGSAVGMILALLVGGLIAAFFAYLIGLPVLRLKSDYLAIATLGFAEIMRTIIQWNAIGPLTNASNLLKGYPDFSSATAYLLLIGVFIACVVLLVNSTYGRAFKAIRDDEVAAEAMGINLAKHKMQAFLISSFFAGIGGASKEGVLIKGSNYLETLSQVKTVVFDKTGTLTKGVFEVSAVHHSPMEQEKLLEYAALAECASSHPISKSLQKAYGKEIDRSRVTDIEEISGRGILAKVDGIPVAAGNHKLMEQLGIDFIDCHSPGTIIHMAVDGKYAGHIVISDVVKPNSKKAIEALHRAGVTKTVMLTGDAKKVADSVAKELGVDEVYSDLLPAGKVEKVEALLSQQSGKAKLAFVGDGINDAPVLSRADIGIAMGAMGSDAAIEAADVVLMDDDPMKIAKAIKISRKCIRIVHENIVFSLGVKLLCLLLVALGGKSLIHETMELLPLSGLLPRATGLHPDVVAVPPVEQQVGVSAEAGRIARGKEDIVGLAAVDGSVGGRRGIGLDGHIEAEGVEVVLDLGGHALNLLVVGGAQGDGTRGDAGLLDELLGLLGVSLVHRGSLMIVGEALGQVAAGSGGKAGEGVGDHLLGVERVHDGLTDLDVVPRLLGDVKHDEAGAEALDVVDLAASALELVDGVSGDELHNERGALLLSGNASGGVGQDAVLDLLILGSILTVVLGVGNQGDLGIGDRVVHPGAGTDRLDPPRPG